MEDEGKYAILVVLVFWHTSKSLKNILILLFRCLEFCKIRKFKNKNKWLHGLIRTNVRNVKVLSFRAWHVSAFIQKLFRVSAPF